MSLSTRFALQRALGGRAVLAGNAIAWAGLVTIVACSESSITGPAASRSGTRVPAGRVDLKGPGGAGSDTSVSTFQYDPAKPLQVNFGGAHKIAMPAGAVCEPGTSGYGADVWDAPCTPTRTRLTFTVKAWTDSTGDPQTAFFPDVRFVPGKVVTLYLQDPNASAKVIPPIVWCTAAMTQCVDEALTDATLVTNYDAKPHLVYRRIKHFSGYMIGW